jgi:hypothetical protein
MTQSYNLSQLANNLNSSGQLDATDGLVGAVPVANGGTSFAAYTVGDILYASGSTAFSKLAAVATGNALLSGGVGSAPVYGKIGLTTHVSGVLPVSNGGTGAATLAANNVLLGNGTSALQAVAPSTAGNLLTSNGTSWVSALPNTLGYNQTWQDVTSSRVSGTTYTNSTGKPIQVNVAGVCTSGSAILYLTVGGVVISGGQVQSLANLTAQVGAIIPPGTSYVLSVNFGTVTPSYWAELR